MSVTQNQFDGFPPDGILLFQLVSSLAQQLEDRMIKRANQVGMENYPLNPADPYQTEIIRLKEDVGLLANTLKAVEDRDQVMSRYLIQIRKELDDLKPRRK